MKNESVLDKLDEVDKSIRTISNIQNELIKTLGYTVMHYPPEFNEPSFKIEKINRNRNCVDPNILHNGLSMEQSYYTSGRKLALNKKIIPGQRALELGKKDNRGVREVTVRFEVYDGE